MFDYFVLCSEQIVGTEYVQGNLWNFKVVPCCPLWWNCPRQGSEFSSLLHTCTLKAKRSKHQESALVFPVVHVLTLLSTRFYFSNVSNTILNISQYTACGCSTSSLTSPVGTCCWEEKWNLLFPGNAAQCPFTSIL